MYNYSLDYSKIHKCEGLDFCERRNDNHGPPEIVYLYCAIVRVYYFYYTYKKIGLDPR